MRRLDMDLSVVIPAYREAANLVVLIPQIVDVLDAAGLRGEIIVVDDDSGDGTEAVCAHFAEQAVMRLITRRASAGWRRRWYAGCAAVGDVLVVMDADLSHPPRRCRNWCTSAGRRGSTS